MNYYLYKMKFTSALHMGVDSGRDNLASSEFTIHSDTVFSALCIEAFRYGGEECLNRLVQIFESDRVSLSDALPYRGNEYFLPKPVYRRQNIRIESDPKDRKRYKKLSYIPVSMFEKYMNPSDHSQFDIHYAVSMLKDIVFENKRQCVAICGQEETQPYFIGSVVFNDGCGLYLIIGYESEADKSMMEKLLISLSYSGIGGKRGVGLGKFTLEAPDAVEDSQDINRIAFQKLLLNRNANFYMTLNTSLPAEQEMEEVLCDGEFMLCRRGGFVQSSNYADTEQKKKTIYAIAPGACLKRTYSGMICNLAGSGGRHPVYRCLKPMFAGVSI